MKAVISLVLVVVCNLAQAGPFIEVGVGKNGVLNSQEWWNGRESTGASFSAGWIWRYHDLQISAQWDHSSQWTRGNGFDSREEHSLDSVFFKTRYEWR